MMTEADWLAIASDVAGGIAETGQSGTITRKTNSGSSYDPTITTTDYACTLVVLDYENRQIDGTRIRAGDKMVYVSTDGLNIDPLESDQITIGSVVHEVVSVKPLSPGGTVVMWEVQCRK